MSTVFVSYARADAETAERIYSEIFNAGYDAWLDTERLVGGSRWRNEIPTVIKTASAFIAVLSKNSVNHRGYVQHELKEALEVLKSLPSNQIYLIPLRLDPVKPSESVLEDLTWIDMFPDFAKGTTKILKALATIPTLGPSKDKRAGRPRQAAPVVPFPEPWSVYKALLALLPNSSRQLGGANGLYLLLRTNVEGLELPQQLLATNPETVALVLQYQYEKLHLGKTAFTVQLSFSGKFESVTVPYSAIAQMREESSGVSCHRPMAA